MKLIHRLGFINFRFWNTVYSLHRLENVVLHQVHLNVATGYRAALLAGKCPTAVQCFLVCRVSFSVTPYLDEHLKHAYVIYIQCTCIVLLQFGFGLQHSIYVTQ